MTQQWLRVEFSEVKIHVHTKTCVQMFVAALFTTTQRWKPPKCPSTDDWINRLWYAHTVEYYSAMKRNEVLIDATTGMNPASITLRERSQS